MVKYLFSGNTAGKIKRYLSGSNIIAHNYENINDSELCFDI